MQSISVFERWRRAVVTSTQSLSTHCTLAPVDSPHLPLHSVQYTQSILNTIHTLHSPSHHIIYPFTPPHHPSHLPPSILTSTSSNLLTNKPFLFHAPHKNHSVAIAAAIYNNERKYKSKEKKYQFSYLLTYKTLQECETALTSQY